MKKATLKALTLSISHWWRLANNKAKGGEGPFSRDCALCGRFRGSAESLCILGNELCPVFKKAGRMFCVSTPYAEATKEYLEEEGFSAQQAEFEFLVSLLPESESWTAPDGWEWYAQ